MIQKNDTVVVTTGKEKGKTGKVISVFVEKNRALVEKLNRVKRHQKPTQKLPQGGVVEKESSIHISNLMLFCQKCGKGVRAGIKVGAKGKKQRVCKKCGENIGS